MVRILYLLCLLPLVGGAQVMLDPTEPPAAQNAGADSADASTKVTNNNGAPVVNVSATFITPNGRYAIINGETVFEGKKWNDLQLTLVDHQLIVLEGKGTRQEYRLENNNNFIKDNSNVF